MICDFPEAGLEDAAKVSKCCDLLLEMDTGDIADELDRQGERLLWAKEVRIDECMG
jgi:hypothetical protein